MEFKVNGLMVDFKPAELQDDQLSELAQEVFTAASERGLELPFATGAVAVEGALRETGTETTAEVPAPTKESIAEQLVSASRGYRATILDINSGRKTKDMLHPERDEAIAAEFDVWFSDEKLAYMVEQHEADPELVFDLVATPNGIVTADEVIKAAQNFGEDQPYSTQIWSDIIKRYKPEEVSGTGPSNGRNVQFSLVPRKLNPELTGSVDFQKRKLADIKIDNPFVRATAPLEDLTRLYTLRAQGFQLSGDGTFDLTYMRNFTMEEQRFGGDFCVPSSYVYGDGRFRLSESGARGGRYGRVVVG